MVNQSKVGLYNFKSWVDQDHCCVFRKVSQL